MGTALQGRRNSRNFPVIVSEHLCFPSEYRNDLASHITLLWFASPTEVMRMVGKGWVLWCQKIGGVADPRSGAFLTPGPGIRTQDPDPG